MSNTFKDNKYKRELYQKQKKQKKKEVIQDRKKDHKNARNES